MTDAAAGPFAIARRVVRNPSLARLGSAFIAFNAAEYGTWIALLVFAYANGGAREAGIVSIVILVPAAVLAPFVGGLGDRFSPARLLRAGYLVQAVTTGLVGAAILAGAPAAVVYAAAAIYGPAFTVTRPTQAVLLPGLVSTPSELTAANAVAGWAESVGLVIGPLIASALIGALGAGGIFLCFAALLLGGYLAVRPLGRGVALIEAEAEDDEPEASSTLAALRHPGVAPLLAVLTAQWVALGAVEILTVVIAFSILDAGASAVGLLDAAAGVGGIASVVLTLRLVGRPRLVPPMVLSSVAWGVVFVAIALQSQLIATFALLALAGAVRYVLDIAGMTLLQRVAPPAVLARVFGLLESFGTLGMAAGSLIVPVAISLTGAEGAVVCVGLTMPLLVLMLLPKLLPVDSHATVPIVEIGLLRSVPMFGLLPGPEIEALARCLEPLRLAAGSTLLREGEDGDRVYVIASGDVAVTRGGEPLATLRRSDVVGEMALLDDAPRNATAVAVTETQLYALDREPFLATLTRHVRANAIARDVATARAAATGGRPAPD